MVRVQAETPGDSVARMQDLKEAALNYLSDVVC